MDSGRGQRSSRCQMRRENSLRLSFLRAVARARLLFAGDRDEGNRVVCRSLKRRSPAPVTSSWTDINVGEP